MVYKGENSTASGNNYRFYNWLSVRRYIQELLIRLISSIIGFSGKREVQIYLCRARVHLW